jgi:phosphodiesterase/alkaline phosphatase D-like protein
MPRALAHLALSCAAAALLAAAPRAAAQAVSPLDLSALASGVEATHPAVAFDGTSFLLVWEEGLRIRGARLDVGGALVGTSFEIAPPADGLAAQRAPAVAAGASGGFLVVWTEDAGTQSLSDVRGARVSAQGIVLDAGGFDVSTVLAGGLLEPAPGPQARAAVAAGGAGFLVVWEDGRDPLAGPDVFGARVDAGGSVLDPDGIAIARRAPAERAPSLAWNGVSYLVVWEDVPAAGAADVLAARVSAAGVADPAFPISDAAGDQVEPAVASDGASFLVAWNDARSGTWEIAAARVGAAGVLDPAGLTLGAAGAAAPHAVSGDAGGYLVAYERGAAALARRLAADGSLGAERTLDAAGVVLPGQALAFAGLGRHLEVHRDGASGVPQLAGALVTTSEPVAVTRAGTGSGAVLSTPGGIDCGATCAAEFETGSEVLLTAAAAAGSTFAGWSGCASPSGATCTLVLSAPLAVTATFTLALPGAPGVPTYASIGATAVTVSWTPAPGATGHELERAPDGGGAPGTFAPVFAGTAASYRDAALAPNTAYWYRVRGTNTAGAGDYGSATSVTTLPGVPGTPTFDGVTASSVGVSWTAPAGGAAGYELERATSAGTDWVRVVAGVTYLDAAPPLAASTTYLYRVRATNPTGPGAYSAVGSVTTLPLAPGVPAAPTYSSLGATSVQVSWVTVAGATTYTLQRAATFAGPWTTVIAGTAGTTHLDGGLAENTTYWYQVGASNGGGDGGFSPTSSVTTLAGAPGAPTFEAVTATSLAVRWTAPAGTADTTNLLYDVQRATAATGPWTSVAAAVPGYAVPDPGPLAAGTIYWYRVRAVTAAGPGAFSAASQVITLPGPPAPPTYSGIGATSVTVSWGTIALATSYDLERGPTSSGPWTLVADGTTATTHVDPTLSPNTTSWYRVRATNGSGDGAFSAASSVTTLPGAPGTPAFGPATASSVTVSWIAPAGGAASYKVERAPDASGVPGAWTQIASGIVPTSTASTGLSANTRYWYRVRATNASGDGAYSPAASVVTAPAAPGAPTLSSFTTTSMVVSWAAPTNGAASYDLDRATAASGPWSPLAVATTARSVADAGLAPGTTYWYRVRATGSTGLTSAYSSASAPTLPEAPGAPTATPAVFSVTVGWGAVTGATSYKLERAPDAGGAPGTWAQVQGGIAATTFDNTGTSPNTIFWYRVRATDASGDGPYSPPTRTMTLPLAPGTPTFSSVTGTSLTVSWTAPTGGAASYEVERATSATGPWIQIGTGIQTLTTADSGLTAGTTYWYRVRAANADGAFGDWSSAGAVGSLPPAPDAPTFSGITEVSLTVHWQPVSGAATYFLERAPDVSGQPGAWVEIAPSLSYLEYNDVTAPNTTYWYRVRAWNRTGYGPYSPASSTSSLTDAPGAPTFTAIGSTGVTVSWTAPAGGAASYVVERAPASLDPWTVVTAGVAALGYVDTGLAPATTYWYRVRATNAAGASGVPSPSGTVTTLPPAPSTAPGAPTFSAIATTSATVSWTDPAAAPRYELERAPDAGGAPGTWAQIATPTARSYPDSGLATNGAYWYRVRAATAGGPGPWSGASRLVTLPGAPGAPAFSSVLATSVVASWAAPAGGAASYELERGPTAAGPWGAAVAVSGTSYLDSGLAAGTTYWYRARARNSAGLAGAASPSASVTTLTAAPGAPACVDVGATSLTVVWTAVTGAAGYRLERAATSSGAWSAIGGTIGGTSSVDSSVAPNTTYWYRVCAVNAAGVPGACSTATTTTTVPGAPGAPAFTAVSASSLTVGWTVPAGGAQTYDVERAPGATGPWEVRASRIAGPSLPESGLTANTTYHYRVRGRNVLGQAGAYSASASVTTANDAGTPPPGPIAPPTYSSVSSAAVMVSWGPASGATRYELERAPDAGGAPGAWTHVAGTTSLGYYDGGRTANTRYWYRVRATNAGGSSTSPPSGVTTAPNAPGPPSFSSVAVTSLVVSWTAPAGGAARYEVERSLTSSGPWLRIAATTATQCTDSALAGGTTYYYRLRALNATGVASATTGWRSIVTAVAAGAPSAGVPGAPTFSDVRATSLVASWAAASGATSYELERATASAGPWNRVASIAATSFSDLGVAANTAYWYRVRASNGASFGAYSAASAVTTAPGAPGAPTFSSVGATSVTVSWTAPYRGAWSYKVERAASGGTFTEVARGVRALSIVSVGLTASTAYSFRVRATNAEGRDGAYSGARSVTTLPDSSAGAPGAPGAPTFSGVGASYLTVSWAPATGATGYKLERATSSAGPWTLIAAMAGTPFQDTGRSGNTRYWYRVCGTGTGGDGAYSTASAITTAPNAPGPPTFMLVAATTVQMTWTAPAGGAATYAVDRATSAVGPWVQVAGNLPTTAFSDGGLIPNTTFYYRVQAANADGRAGLPSYVRSVLTAADASIAVPGPPGAPTFSGISASALTVGWTAAVGATSHELQRASASSGPWAGIATVSATTFTDTGRAANTTYWYRVRGSNAGGAGAWSGASAVTTAPNAPGAPTFASISATSVTVIWTAPAGGAASYALERRLGSEVTWTRVLTGTTSLSHVDAGLAEGTGYSYRVAAANGDGVAGLYSAARSVTTAAIPGT